MNENDTPLRAGVYCRVSTDESARSGSIENQIVFARRYCELHHITIAGIYTDEAVSGTVHPSKRPGASSMLAAARLGLFDVVLFYRVDRLSRKLLHLLEAEGTLEGLGVGIRSMTESYDTTTSTGRFVFRLLGQLAELEREVIEERTEQGRHRALSNGKAPGRPPIGYRRDDAGRFVEEPGEAAVIREVFRLAASGMSSAGIARELTRRGVPPQWVARRYRAAKGSAATAGVWRHPAVLGILHNELYWTGRYVYSERAGPAFTIDVPALVEPALAMQAHRQLERNNSLPKRPTRGYLLSGLVKCGRCGGSWVSTTGSAAKLGYYHCNSDHFRRRFDPSIPRCGLRATRSDELDAKVWGDIVFVANHPGDLAGRISEELSRSAADVEALRGELRRISSELERVTSERRSAMQSAERGEITRSELSAFLKAGVGRVGELERAQGEIVERLAARQLDEARMMGVEAVCARLRELVEEAEDDFALKRELVKSLVDSVVAHRGEGKATEFEVRYALSEGLPGLESITSDGSAKNRNNQRARRSGRSSDEPRCPPS